MKKIFIYLLSALLLMLSCFALPQKKAYATSSDNSVIILSGEINQQNKLVIQANLTVNTGISAMILELSYNKNVMVLSNVVFGNALSSLDYEYTGRTDPNVDFSYTPFKFEYDGANNDFSTGNLFTLTFNLYEVVEDGIYKVSLKYSKNKDVNYYDNNGNLKTKNLYIDNAEIQFKNNSVIQIKSVVDSQSDSKIWIIVLCVSISVVVVCGVLIALKLLKKRRNWKRI